MNNSTNAPLDLRDRTLNFSISVIRFLRPFRNQMSLKSIVDQLTRSATSIGANFVEAKDAVSKKDFRHKVAISKKEAAETLYWLNIFQEFTSDKQLGYLQQECKEIILILQKILSTTK